MPSDYQLECLPEVQAVLEAGLPNSFSLADRVRSVYNQGARPSCVCESTCGMKSIQDLTDINIWQLYDATECYVRNGGNGSNGVPTDSVLSFVKNTGLRVQSTERRFRLQSYMFAPQVYNQFRQTLCAAVMATGPCVVALLLPSNFGWSSSGSKTSGYHQVAIIGWEGLGDNDWCVILNSWGSSWGNRGMGRIPWNFMEENGSFQNRYCYAYTCVDFKDGNVIPTPTPVPTPIPDPVPTPIPDPVPDPTPNPLVIRSVTGTRVVAAAGRGEAFVVGMDGLGAGVLQARIGGEPCAAVPDGTGRLRVTAPAISPLLARLYVRREGVEAEGPFVAVVENGTPAPTPIPDPIPDPTPTPTPDPGTLTVVAGVNTVGVARLLQVRVKAGGSYIDATVRATIGGQDHGAQRTRVLGNRLLAATWVVRVGAGTPIVVGATAADGRTGRQELLA